ncbi:MAG: TetR family transcriptional regulator C-terminal domain-containing protein [Rhodospirillales bacterium]
MAPEARRQEILAAARRCLARSGFNGFTVAEIAATAGISNGLIGHYFPTKDALLVATYEAEAARLLAATRAALSDSQAAADIRLRALVDSAFCPEIFNEETVATWLSLWGQVRSNPALREAHKAIYETYRKAFANAIGRSAERRGLRLDTALLAVDVSALIDGLWLEWGLDPEVFSPAAARQSCYRLLAAHGIALDVDERS